MNRRKFITALASAGAVGATIGYVAKHQTPKPPKSAELSQYLTSRDTWYIKDWKDECLRYRRTTLSQESIENMIKALNRHGLDGTKQLMVKPTRMLVTGKNYNMWRSIYGSSGQ